MTVRVTTLKGTEAGRYYTEQLPSYYLDTGEPPGRWFGHGARMLGLDGVVDDEAFLAVMAGLHPTTGERLGRRFGDRSVRGFDATFSAPKSVSVLFAIGDEQLRREVTEAHDRAVDAVLGWVESQAHTRMRRRGHVVCVEAEGIVAGVFRQHTSRSLDPQLHHTRGDRQPGPRSGRALVGARCPHVEDGSANFVGFVSRRATGRADPPPRSPLAPT